MAVKSGQFNYDAVTRECPTGFTKIVEGTTAVLEPPPKEKTASDAVSQKHQHAKYNKQQRDNGDNGDGDTDLKEEEEHAGQQVDQAVFYNPAQVVNRDLSISAIELFSRLRLSEPQRRGGTKDGITILEALSATGLRAIRYFKEITNVRYIIANDMDADAVDCIVRNCAYNGVPVAYPTLTENMPAAAIELYTQEEAETSQTGVGVRAGGAILPNLDDANDLMFRLAVNATVHPGQRMCLVDTAAPPEGGEANVSSSSSPSSVPATSPPVRPLLQQELMDVVDLDPYGSASPFLDAAFRCIKEGGLMLVTSTDSSILCGNFADTAHAKYSSFPYKASHCHEAAVRTLLASIERVANKHRKYIVPMVSLHIDFYVRCFFRVYTQAAEVKLSACKLGYQLQCTNCSAFWVRPMATARPPRPSRQDRRRQKREHNEQQRLAHAAGSTASPAAAAAVGSKRARETEAEKEAAKHGDDSNGGAVYKEVYPATPSRQVNPKLSPLTLQQLPHASPSMDTAAAAPADVSTCPVCGSNVVLSGPLYAAPTQNHEFLQQLLGIFEERSQEGRLNAEARITGLVRIALEELPDCPLFYLLPDVASYVRVRCPPTPYIVGALARLGYRCSQVHCAAAGLKTDCPPEVLYRVMLQWKALQDKQDAEETKAEERDINTEESDPPSPPSSPVDAHVPRNAARPLLVAPLAETDFTYDKAYDFRGRVIGVAKFVPNAPGWGPRRRHQGAAVVKGEEEMGGEEA